MTGKKSFALIASAVLATSSSLWADYEVPNAAYNAPTHYYDSASGTGFTLRTNLHNIVTTGFFARSYGDSRFAMGTGNIAGDFPGGLEDLDPNNSNNVLLVYNRGSVSAKWDAGNQFNREHVWPKALLNLTSSQVSNTYKGVASDAFELRPADPNINSGRNDDGYGFYPNVGNGSPAPKAGDVSQVTDYGTNTNSGTTYWFPGDADRGEVARIIFYMATRWFDPTNPSRGTSNTNLDLKNGAPALYNFGDLNSLLHWNYSAGVDNFERRRNQYIYGSSGDLTDHALNPNYYQNNRNPYIDHPEYVWAIWGTEPNNSQLSVGGPAGDGTSSTNVDLGRVIRNASITASSTATLTKTGADPTTFDVTTANGATSTLAGTGQPMDYGNQSKSMTVGLSASTSTAGVKSGTITVRNTDLTSSGAGHGSADGNDTITVSATVVDHSTGSFDPIAPVGTLTLDFGYVPQGFAARSITYNISNLAAASGFTANMDIKSVGSSGDTGSLSSDAAPATGITPNSSRAFNANLTTASPGTLSSTYVITPGDEAIPGATNGANMSLNLSARVISSATFPATGFIQLNNGETYTTGPMSIASSVTLTKTGPGTLTISDVQTHGAGAALAATAGTTNINTDAGSAGNQLLALSASNVGTVVNLNATQHLASLSIDSGAAVAMPTGMNKALVLNTLSITGTSTLDLNDNGMVIDYGAETTHATRDAIRNLLINGRNAGPAQPATWNGAGGIISTYANQNGNGFNLAIGYADNTDLAAVRGAGSYTSFAGETVASNTVLVQLTRGADATLDGVVDAQDVTILGSHFNKPGSGQWVFGDFDYSGTCDATDVTTLGSTFGKTSPTLSPAQMTAEFGSAFAQAFEAGQSAAVPEPATLALLGLATTALAPRRRRVRAPR